MRNRFQNNLSAVSLYDDWREYVTNSHTDIPRIREGQLGGQVKYFFIILLKAFLIRTLNILVVDKLLTEPRLNSNQNPSLQLQQL